MGDFVLGLAKTVVEGALTKAQSAIEEEKKLQESVQQDLVFITGEFQMMQSFLNATSVEHVRNNVVRTWVRQVRDLAYDVEDCIEFIVHLDKRPAWWRRLLPSCMPAAALPLDKAVANIKQLKARVEDVSHRNTRYNLISDSVSKPAVAQQQPAAADATAFNMFVEARIVARKQRGLVDLAELITKKDDDLQVISVWGTGGNLGMTAIIRKAYDDPEICKKFGCRGWAKLTYPFNPYEFLRSLLTQFYTNYSQEQGTTVDVDVLKRMEAATPGGLVEEFMKQLKEQRYLVVLEGMSTMVEWDAIRTYLPDRKNGSGIVISTQQFEIASLCTGQPHRVSELKQFSADHSVCVFFKEVSQREGGDEGEGTSNETVVAEGEAPSHGDWRGGHRLSSSGRKLTFRRGRALAWKDEFRLVGRDKLFGQLKEKVLTSYDSFRVISVWGIPGVGKSALVRRVYYSHMLEGSGLFAKRFDKYGWVDVTNDPFNLRDLFRSLLLDLYYYSESTKAKESTEFGLLGISDPIQECCKFLRAHKCLIVLDGLQSTADWDLIKAALASGPSYPSCTVIVITNEASVAKHCSMRDEGMVCSVNGLDADAALGLFKEVCGEAATKDDYIEEAKHILSKCGGLPKVIVTIGASLATTSIWNWRYMKTALMHELETNPEFESVQGLFVWMNSYFRTCPDFLKPCIFYLTVFPRDHSIRRRRLVRRWIAEGYSRDTYDGTTEENGEMFFTKLVELSMIQQPTQAGTRRRRMVLCQVNGFIREYVNSRPMEDNLVLTLEGRCSLNSQRTGRHLAIGSSWDRDRIVFESIDFSRLRSLTVFGKWESFFISETMKVLRVLDLEDASDVTDDDLEQIVVRLPRLKFLSLRRCTEICRLPDSLGDLRQLQTLDVRHTSVVALPPAIIKLRKLQYIRAGTAIPIPSDDVDTDASLPAAGGPSTPSRRRGLRAPLACRRHRPVEVPRGIGELTALHTLGVVNVSDAGGEAILKELKKLTQLRKLGVSGVNRRNSQLLCSAISGHGHLESLSVRLEYEEESFYACLDGVSPPPENLETLKLNGNIDRFPEWIKHIPFLRLCFHVGTSVQDIPIRDLEELLRLGHQGSGRELWPDY